MSYYIYIIINYVLLPYIRNVNVIFNYFYIEVLIFTVEKVALANQKAGSLLFNAVVLLGQNIIQRF